MRAHACCVFCLHQPAQEGSSMQAAKVVMLQLPESMMSELISFAHIALED